MSRKTNATAKPARKSDKVSLSAKANSAVAGKTRLPSRAVRPRTTRENISSAKNICSESMQTAVIAETLEVGKRVVVTGAIRIRKRVHEEHVVVDEPLTADAVDVERIAVNREVQGPVAIRYEGDVMIVPVVEERVVTRKQLVLVEEIRITRRTFEQRAPQTVSLRREEIIAERMDPASGEWKDERVRRKP